MLLLLLLLLLLRRRRLTAAEREANPQGRARPPRGRFECSTSCACVAFELDLLHALEHRAVRVDGAHVMAAAALLAARAHLAQRATGGLKILAGVVLVYAGRRTVPARGRCCTQHPRRQSS